LEARADAELAIRVCQMELDRLLGDEQALSHLAISRATRSHTRRSDGVSAAKPVSSSWGGQEDHDNEIDIVLGGDQAAVSRIKAVEIPAVGRYHPF
jgi:hypothetical protein